MLPIAFRTHQEHDVFTLLRPALYGGSTRILFEASVGYGKSKVIAFLAWSWSKAGKRVWVLSNRSAVVGQLAGATSSMPNVIAMTVQAADRRRPQLAAEPADLILIDEAHMGGAAPQYSRVMDCAPNARVIAFTGTPTPQLFDVFPTHIKGHGAKWLTENGWLAPLLYHTPNKLDLRKIAIKKGEYDEAAVMALLEERRIYGHAIDSYRTYGQGVPTLGFCVNVKHAEATAEEFRKAGHPCDVLVGADSEREVERKIQALTDGGLVFSVDKVSAGFDLPDLRVILSLRPTASEQLWVQQLGRVARAADGKTHGMVCDHVGNARRLGSLTEERDWRHLEETQAARLTEDGDRLSMRTCDACLATFESGPTCCPCCGASLARDTRIPRAESVRLAAVKAEELDRERAAAKEAKAAAKAERERLEAEKRATAQTEKEAKARAKAEEDARKKVFRRMGGGYKQRRARLVHQGGLSWSQAHHIALDQLRKRLDEALRFGDTEMEAAVRSELEPHL